MKTFNDLLALGDSEKARMDFILQAINEHKSSTMYQIAVDADMYYRHLNPTIMRAQKFVYDLMGRAHVDEWSAIEIRVLEPDEGMILTNGDTYSKRVYLGVNDTPENWHEIPDGEVMADE